MRASLRAWWREGEPWYAAVGLANLVLGTSSVLIPLMVSQVLDRTVSALGVLSSLVSLVGVIGSLIWGRLSDGAHRRKPFVVLSYAAVGACFLAIAFIPTFDQLVIVNMLMNFFWVANASVTVLIVIENRDQSHWERKIGHLNQVGAFGWVAGLALGSAALAAGAHVAGEATAIRSLFFIIGAAAFAAAFLAIRTIPFAIATLTRRPFRGLVLALGNFVVERVRYGPFHLYYRLQPRRIIAALTRPQGFRVGTKRFLAATLVAFTGLGFFGIPLPLMLAQRFSFSSSLVFLYFMIQHLAIVAAYPLATQRIRRHGNKRVQFSAIFVRLVLFGAVSVYLAFSSGTPPTWALIAAFLLYGFTWSYFQLSGIALTSRLARPENRGMALGLYNALAGIGWILAGVGGGYLAQWLGYQASCAAAAALLAASLVILWFVPNPPRLRAVPAASADAAMRTSPGAPTIEAATADP